MKSITRYVLAVLCLCIFVSTADADIGLSKAVKKIVHRIEKVDRVVMEWNTEGGSPKEEDNFKQLRKRATTNELMLLMDHPNPVVRCHAFRALAYDTSVDLFESVLSHLTDTQVVATQHCDVGWNQQAADFYIELVTPEYGDRDLRKFSNAQMSTLDSILVCTDNDLDAKQEALERIEPNDWAYPRIRELAMRTDNPAVTSHYWIDRRARKSANWTCNPSAWIALAKYRKEQDIELIKEQLNRYPLGKCPLETYLAVSYFPHSDFFPILTAHFISVIDNSISSFEVRGLYHAIASYHNNEALALLKRPLEEISDYYDRNERVGFLFDALREFKASIYDQLLLRLWSNEHKVSRGILQYISTRYPDSALQLARISLSDLGTLFELDAELTWFPSGDTGLVSTALFDYVLARDRSYAMRVLEVGIRGADWNSTFIICDWMSRTRDTAVVGPVLERMRTDTGSFISACFAQSLFDLNDPSISRKIIDELTTDKQLRKSRCGNAILRMMKERGVKL